MHTSATRIAVFVALLGSSCSQLDGSTSKPASVDDNPTTTLGASGSGSLQPKGPSQDESPIDQANVCEVQAWQYDVVAAACKPGQKVLFTPSRWGNEQLPVIFAAVNCDLRYSVALTNGAVACIYRPIAPAEQAKVDESAKAQPTTPSSSPETNPKDVPAAATQP